MSVDSGAALVYKRGMRRTIQTPDGPAEIASHDPGLLDWIEQVINEATQKDADRQKAAEAARHRKPFNGRQA